MNKSKTEMKVSLSLSSQTNHRFLCSSFSSASSFSASSHTSSSASTYTSIAPFLFSCADALEIDGRDFKMAEVCGATTASRAVGLRSTDGRKKMGAIGGGVAMSNPTAAAITHVLNNKQEFCKGVEDLIVVSLGNGEMDCAVGNHWNSSPAEYS